MGGVAGACCVAREPTDAAPAKQKRPPSIRTDSGVTALANIPPVTKSTWFRRCWCCKRRSSGMHIDPSMIDNPDQADKIHAQITANVHNYLTDGSGDWVQVTDAARMLIATEGDIELAQEKLVQAVQWRDSQLTEWIKRYSPTPFPNELRIIGHGFNRRPILYGCAVHQRKGEISPIEWACGWDYAIRQSPDPNVYLDMVIDVHGFQLLLNLNLMPFLEVAKSLDSYYAERFHRFVVIDMPAAARFIWKGIRPLLPPKTRNKVFFVSSGNPEEMEILYELCPDDAMRSSVAELIAMNRRPVPESGRAASRAHSDKFMLNQLDQLAEHDK